MKRTREESDADGNSEMATSPSEEYVQGLQDRCDASKTFARVKTRHDVAVLEFSSKKMRQFIVNLVSQKKDKCKDGVRVQVVMKKPQVSSSSSAQECTFAQPLALRIPSNMTVYGLRKELANRLSRPLQSSNESPGSGESSGENGDRRAAEAQLSFGSPELLVMRQLPLTYDRKGPYGRSSLNKNKKLGMLERPGDEDPEGRRQATMAVSSDEAEQVLVAETVGPDGTINLDWSTELLERSFDVSEYEVTEDVKDDTAMVAKTEKEKPTTVLDCIKKYCQKEQLEESEMWYCNQCKKQVRAWKQFHLYSAPPILIVHLKRFHYSATTHRRDKITSLIDFPLKGLDLSEIVTQYSEQEKPIYDCYAVSNHYGGLGGGHYTAYTLSDDGTWCHYDDSRVTNDIDSKEVVSEAAYVLYYRRQDVPLGEDFVESVINSPMVCEHEEIPKDSSEVSSNNTAQAGDDDRNEDTTMDEADVSGDEASSRTGSSQVVSMDGDNLQPHVDSLTPSEPEAIEVGNFPLQ